MKRPGKLDRGGILPHDNARPHTNNTITTLLQKFKWGGSLSPSIQSRPLSLRLRHIWSPKKGSEEQTIHFGRPSQAVRAELVQNAVPGILRDSHSPPCVALGQVP